MKDEGVVAAKELEYSPSLGLLDYLDPYNNVVDNINDNINDPYSHVDDNEQQYDYMNPMHCTVTNKQNTSRGDTRIDDSQCTEFSAISSFSSFSSNSDMGCSKGTRWAQPDKFPAEVGIVQHSDTTDIGVCFSREHLTVGCDSNNPITLDEQSISGALFTTTTTPATSGCGVVEMISEEEKSPEFHVVSGGDSDDRTGESEMLETLITAMHENNENSNNNENNNSENDKNTATNELKTAHETTHEPLSETCVSDNNMPSICSKQPAISEISSKEQFLEGISAAFSSQCTAPPENVVDVASTEGVVDVASPVALPSWMEDIKAKMDGAGYSKAGTQEKCTCSDNGDGQFAELSEGPKGCVKCSANQNTTARNRRKNKRKKELAAKGLSMCLNDFIGGPAKKPCTDKITTNNKSDITYTDVSMGCNVDGTANAEVPTVSSVAAISTDASVSVHSVVDSLVNESDGDPMKSSVTGDNQVAINVSDQVAMNVSDQFVVQHEGYVADVANVEHDTTNYAVATREYTHLSDPREVLVARNEFTTTTTMTHKDNHLRGCLWSPDGCSVLTNSDDNVLRLFNIPDVADASCGEEMRAAVRMQEGNNISLIVPSHQQPWVGNQNFPKILPW